MKRIFYIFSAVILLFASGCASIVSKSKWPVTFNSKPSGAIVVIKRDPKGEEIQRGITPFTATLRAGGGFHRFEYYVEMKKDDLDSRGYLTANENPVAWGNVGFIVLAFVGWPIGGLIDAGTGAAFKLPPDYFLILTESQPKVKQE